MADFQEMFITLIFLSSRDSEKLETASCFSRQDVSNMYLLTLNWQFENLNLGQDFWPWPGSNFLIDFSRSSDTYFDASWREKCNGVFSLSLSILDNKLSKLNIFSKIGHFSFKARRTLISYYIYLRSQHTVIRATYGLCSAVFGFALAVIFFEYLSIFLEK